MNNSTLNAFEADQISNLDEVTGGGGSCGPNLLGGVLGGVACTVGSVVNTVGCTVGAVGCAVKNLNVGVGVGVGVGIGLGIH